MTIAAPAVDFVAIESVSLERWGAALKAVGHDVPPLLSHDSVRAILEKITTTDELADLVQAISDLGNDAGRDALVDAARDQGVDTTTWDAEESPQDLVARTWVDARSNDQAANFLARALVEVQEQHSARPHQEFVGRQARSVDGRKRRDLLRQKIMTWCNANQRGDHLELRVYVDGSRTIFHVIHGHRIVAPLVVEDGGRKVLRHRPAHFDHVEYDESTGTLKVSTQSRELVDIYKSVFGQVLFNDAAFFDSDDVCTLRPLQEKGRAALSLHGVGGEIESVRLAGCVWKHGEHHIHIHGRDCFDALEQKFSARLGEGQLVAATLVLVFQSGKPRRVRVTIKVPNRITYRRDIRRDDIIERFLRQVGIRATSEKRRTVWALADGAHQVEVWKTIFGGDVDSLVKSGVLKTARRSDAEHPDHPRHGAVLAARDVDDGRGVYGVSIDPDVASRTLTPSDRDALELDDDALGKRLALDLQLQGGVEKIGRSGAIALGRRKIGNVEIAPVLLAREPADRETLADLLCQQFKSTRLVLLVPTGGEGLPGLSRICLNSVAGSFEYVLQQIIVELGIEREVPARLRAPPGKRLIIDKSREEMWIDDVRLLIDANTQHFDFMFVLAEAQANGARLKSEEVSAKLSRNADGHLSRQVKQKVLEKITNSFVAVGKSPPTAKELFDKYELLIPAFIG